MIRDKGRFHIIHSGIGQITIPTRITKKLELKNGDKVSLEWDNEVLRVSKL